MSSSKLHKIGLMAAVAGMLLVGCGSPAPVAGIGANNSAGTISAGYGARDAQVGAETNMVNLNASGDLESLTDFDIESLDDPNADIDDADEAKKTETKVKKTTKAGFIRTNTDGKFFLQVSKGFLWWKRESSIPLAPGDESTSLKVASKLNKKVLLRGALQGETIVVSKVCGLLDFGQVWDLLSKGTVDGKVYDAKTLVGIAHADITVKSFATGRMWRTKSDTTGAYKVGRLDAGDYEIVAKSADYSLGAKDKIVVKKRSKTKAHLGLSPEGASLPPTK